ncbi:hypothetical protein [Neorhizobium galegae]|uniref:hypothetical protein n=2 Tax=Neorhizobium TaxID=1525371 RepID=UPI000CFA2F65|nr:hypothetical protein [Neorhizobium galegae]MCQ1850451.1 hypothetical protein [Neorhizobium galegae]
MERWISGGQYAQRLGMRLGAFVVITLAFPFFVYGMIKVTGAGGVSGASGALALVLGIYLKPIIYLGFAYSTLRLSLNRTRTIGVSPLIGLCIPLLVLADLPFGITFGSFWAVGFSLGIMSSLLPASLLAAAIAVTTLSLWRDIEEPMTGRIANIYGIWKTLLFISVGLGFIGILPMVSAWFIGSSGVKLSILLIRSMSYLRAFLLYPYGLLLAFAALSTALILESRRPHNGGGNYKSTQNQAPLFGSRNIKQ